ncbi:MAG: apolipoprotein N-acyltransferase [Alphaproteobacteria bacterium]
MRKIFSIGMLRGWRRNFAAFAFGVCATFTLPPFFFFPLLIPAFSGLFLLLHGAENRRRMFLDGWWWGWGYYITGLYWFCIALLTDAEKFAWLIPFALFGLTAVIALYNGVICLLFSFIRLGGIGRIAAFSFIWLGVEYARGHLFTGFPWNLAGYIFAASDISIQLASLVGAYGLTWFAVLLGVVPALCVMKHIDKKHAITCAASVYLVLCIGLAWGAWRLHQAGETQFVKGVKIRLVQANIAQHHKWDPALQMEGLRAYAELTQAEGIETITHVIWPETAVPYVVREGSRLTEMLGAVLAPHSTLITGALRAEGAGQDGKIWNSVVALDANGNILGSYDKHKLVPFGEFLPFRSLIPEKWATPVGNKDFSAGTGPATLDWAGLSGISPLICYEAIFPELAVNNDHTPSLLLNLTNDAWFGTSSGPHQHFHMSRMRAVEHGIPMIRVANTGISAVIDSYGRVIQRLELEQGGVIDTGLPEKANLY